MPECKEKKKSRVFKIFRLYHSPVVTPPFKLCRRRLIPTVAHNCHGKTKSHGTTNFTHGKTKLTHGSVVDEDANFCKSCGRGTFLNLKCPYLHLF